MPYHASARPLPGRAVVTYTIAPGWNSASPTPKSTEESASTPMVCATAATAELSPHHSSATTSAGRGP